MADNKIDSIQKIKEFLARKKGQVNPDVFLFEKFELPNGEANLNLFHGVETGGSEPYWEKTASFSELDLAHKALSSVGRLGADIASTVVSFAGKFAGVFDKDAGRELKEVAKKADIDGHIGKAKNNPITKHVQGLKPAPILDTGDFFKNLVPKRRKASKDGPSPYKTLYRILKDGPVAFANIRINTKYSKPIIGFRLRVIVGYDQRGFFIFPKEQYFRSDSNNNVLDNIEHVDYDVFRSEINQQVRDIEKHGLLQKIKDLQQFGCKEFLNSFDTQGKYIVFFRFNHFKGAKNFRIESVLSGKFLKPYKTKVEVYKRKYRQLFINDIVPAKELIKSFVLNKDFVLSKKVVLSKEKLNSTEIYSVLLDIIQYFSLYTHHNVKFGSQIFELLFPWSPSNKQNKPTFTLNRLDTNALTLLQGQVMYFLKMAYGIATHPFYPFKHDKEATYKLVQQLREASGKESAPINLAPFWKEITSAQRSVRYQRFLGRLARHLRRFGPNITKSYNVRLKKKLSRDPALRERHGPVYKRSIPQGTICIKGGLVEPDDVYFSRQGNDLKIKWKDGVKIYEKELIKTWKNGTKIYRDKKRKDDTKILRRTTSARGIIIKDFWPSSSAFHLMHQEYNSRKYKFLLTVNGTNPKAHKANWGIDSTYI